MSRISHIKNHKHNILMFQKQQWFTSVIAITGNNFTNCPIDVHFKNSYGFDEQKMLENYLGLEINLEIYQTNRLYQVYDVLPEVHALNWCVKRFVSVFRACYWYLLSSPKAFKHVPPDEVIICIHFLPDIIVLIRHSWKLLFNVASYLVIFTRMSE